MSESTDFAIFWMSPADLKLLHPVQAPTLGPTYKRWHDRWPTLPTLPDEVES